MSNLPQRILVPGDSASRSVGADDVADRLTNALPAGTTIVRNGSRGLFWLEPLVEVERDGKRLGFGPVTVDDVDDLVAAGFPEDGHPLALGPVDTIPQLARQQRLIFARCGQDAPLDLPAYEAAGGLAGLARARAQSPDAIIEAVKTSGLRGRGGAGFPAGIKWETASKATGSETYLCCNADEGDSGTYADRLLMEGDPFTLIEGMCIAARAISATHGLVYLRSEYPDAIRTLKAAIDVWRDAGHFKGLSAGDSFDIEVRTGAGAYICGEESSMLNSLEGKRGEVRAKPPIPAISGLFGQPTIVNNVLTLASVPWILAHGGDAYREFGTGRSRGTQAFQLAGDIRQGALIELAFGASLRTLIEDFGGGTRSGRPLRAVQVGGPLGAYLAESDLDVALEYEALAAIGGMLGHGGIVVFNDTVNMARQARFAMEFCAIESCGKCTPCRVGATRGRETLDKIINGEDVTGNLALIEDLCELMTDGSLCAMGGLTPMPVRSAIKRFPEDFTRPLAAE
ncbi:NADH-ubiquinone oxidoreductase-F iron-sulfur binding region domain-containing protein [Maricaulis sp.]|uniref:NADH-ubiquinone oxidoreductase-F iron-sulfur binding region domain-containing protein n=1 Tax=Maricaulis sp. TaxID=1486257 RepID=UPI002B26FE81|nr:NADH-ubiquinone oxidoreductase-F iron-sulfur binding region domain-containing protein [Maricaulis sp.]